MATNVPAPVFGPNGFVPPTEAAILAGVQADQQVAFGGDLNPALNTPQGQLAVSTAAIIGDANDQFMALANGVDPALASGRMQDAIARIYFLERKPAQSTVVEATCSGLTGTTIPIGARAQDQGGNVYLAIETGVIPVGGTIALDFACATAGPIACPPSFLTSIYQAIPGWDSVTNAGAGVEGTNVESRAEFEARRQQSVALNAQGSLPSVLAAVLNIAGVLDAYATENTTGSTVLVGGVNLAPHSLYVAAYGGDSTAIATAIWTKKSPGCDYNGNTTITIFDTVDYAPPYPAYAVTFMRPTPTPIKFSVLMQANTQVPSGAAALVKAAITTAFTGADGGQRARIGSAIFASRFYAGVSNLGAWALVYSILLGPTTPTLNSVIMQIDQIPTITDSDITVTFS